MIMSSGANRIIWIFGIILKEIPVNGQKIRYLLQTAGEWDDIGLDEIMERHRRAGDGGKQRSFAPHLNGFESYRSCGVDDIGLDKIKVLRPSSRAQAGVHRTPAFNLFESYI